VTALQPSPFRLAAFAVLLGTLPVHAGDSTETPGFATRVLPILTKAGCNTGACHGAAVGQGGFKLSLLGYDPEQDFENITRELSGRRLDLAAPEQSLLLRKSTRQLDHEGGRRIKRDSEAHRTLLDWIAASAPFGPRELRVTQIEVTPRDILLLAPGKSHQLRVTARLSDGRTEDVTSLALYNSDDDGIADVATGGEVTVSNRGLTAIMVRYLGQVAAVRVGAPFQNAEMKNASFPTQNFIDEKILAELQRLRIPPSPLVGDAEFFRRVHLDVAGRLPAPGRVRAFLAEPPSAGKRVRVIDELLASPAFVDFWTLKLADLLVINSKKMGDQGTMAYHGWLREQLAANAPFNRTVSALLTATGDTSQHGPANFFGVANDPRDLGEFVSQTFLGMRVACARCHNHPFDRWTMNDYHHFAAYFARTGHEGTRVVVRAHGEVQHPKSGKDVLPRPLGHDGPAAEVAGDRRGALAAWMTSPGNPMLAHAVVNRVWKALLGRGLIEPVDDVRATNPASNPALLDALAADFAKHNYDLRRLVRTIVASRTYQLSPVTNEINRLDERFFSHAYLKPLTAQVLADAIAQVTGVPEQYPGYPEGTTATQLPDSQVASYALDVFGRCPRTTSCENPAQFGGGLSQALHLINGRTVNARLGPALKQQLPSGSDRAVIEEIYLRSLSRPPTDQESAHWSKALAASSAREEFLEDLLWALLNSREFAFNH
jgi:hypothetical protein